MKKTLLAVAVTVLSTSAYSEQVIDVQKSNSHEKSSSNSIDLKTSHEIVQRAKSVIASVEQSGRNSTLGACSLVSQPKDTVDDNLYHDGSRSLMMLLPSISESGRGQVYGDYYRDVLNSKMFTFLTSNGLKPTLANYSLALPIMLFYAEYREVINRGGLMPQRKHIMQTFIGQSYMDEWLLFASTLQELGVSQSNFYDMARALMQNEDYKEQAKIPNFDIKGGLSWSVNMADFTELNYEPDLSGSSVFFKSSSYKIITPPYLKLCAMATAQAVHDAAKMIAAGKDESQVASIVASTNYAALPNSVMTKCQVPTMIALKQGQTAQIGMRCNDGFVWDTNKQEAYFKGVPWLSDAVVQGDKFSYESGNNKTESSKSSTNKNSNKKTLQ